MRSFTIALTATGILLAAATVTPAPARIEENCGQVATRFAYVARSGTLTAGLAAAEITLAAGSGEVVDALTLRLVGGREQAPARGLTAAPGQVSYLRGRDRGRWIQGVPVWQRVRFQDVWPGIDAEYHTRGSELELDFVVAPGVDPALVRIAAGAGEHLSVEPDGSLIVASAAGSFRQSAPVIWQDHGQDCIAVAGGFVALASGELGFSVERPGPDGVLTIDPTLEYGSFLGGEAGDIAHDVLVDSQDRMLVVGYSSSTLFPLLDPLDAIPGGTDAFITRLTEDGSALVFSTFLGGSGVDEALAVALGPGDAIYVLGETESSDFPTTAGVVQPVRAGSQRDLWVARLTADGQSLDWATYLGGNEDEVGAGIAVDSSGEPVVVGQTFSGNYPLVAPVQSARDSLAGGFVTRLSADATSLRASTYLGEFASSVDLDALGRAVVVGVTRSASFPTVNPFQPARNGMYDAFLSRFEAGGPALDYSTYLGGSDFDWATAVRVDDAGRMWLGGFTDSLNLPLAAPLQSAIAGAPDWFISAFQPDGAALEFSTYLGGPTNITEVVEDIRHAPSGDIVILGDTGGDLFPLIDSLWPSSISSIAAIAVLRADRTAWRMISNFPETQLLGLAVDSQNRIIVVGQCSSNGAPPMARPFQGVKPGQTDGVIARIELASCVIPAARIDTLLGVKTVGPGLAWSWQDAPDAAEYHLYSGVDRTLRPDLLAGTALQGAPALALAWPAEPLVLYQVVAATPCGEGPW